MKTVKIRTEAQGRQLLEVLASIMSIDSENNFDELDGQIVEYSENESPVYWSIVSIDEDEGGVKTIQLDC